MSRELLASRKNRIYVDLYREDPIVRRTLGVESIPSVPTISRMLDGCDRTSVSELQEQSRSLVLERLALEALSTVTLDFDGSVISTNGKAEGVAAGFSKKKGMRSYYPLFCTLAQGGQILDASHRGGNVHDSNGTIDFVERCVGLVRGAVPAARVEVRMDSAFFRDRMVLALERLGVEFAISVPFELKGMAQGRSRWTPIPGGGRPSAAFERRWKPKSWKQKARFAFVRSQNPKQAKSALQLDLFEPKEFGPPCIVGLATRQNRPVSSDLLRGTNVPNIHNS